MRREKRRSPPQSASLRKRRVTVRAANRVPLGEAKQPGGKIVHVWAVEGDWEAARLKSNMFEMEWPPRSGRRQMFPELDRAEWFGIDEAHAKILKGQAVFLDRLLAAIVNG